MRATCAGLLCLLGCQTYDFEPVTPLGVGQTVKKVQVGVQQLKPNVFLVVDKSGSMSQEVSPGVSRIVALQSAMGTFLTNGGASAHLGLLPYPSDDTCGLGDATQIGADGVPLDEGDEDDVRMRGYAASVKAAIDDLKPKGGTPTGSTMKSLGSYAALQARDRANFAVLLTDGLPNCNPDLNATSCVCTSNGLPSCNLGPSNLCLDDSGSAAEIAGLKSKGIRTIVVGFGTDVMNTQGANTLASMAAAGGFNRPCTTSADCNAGDTCNAGGTDPCGRPASTCGQSFFQATNAAELGTVLETMKKSFTCPPCRQVLNASPSDPSMVSVLIDGQAVPPGADTWQFRPDLNAPAVEFLGATCAQLEATTVAQPMRIEIRTVEAL